jgi:Glycogen recognition site of AMP-activated protein kinase
MSERIHAYLDGDLPLEALSPDERARARELEDALYAATAQLRASPAPDLTARVMAALPAAAPRRREAPWKAALGWLWAPRPVRVTLRPAYGLAFAALAAVALTQLPTDDGRMAVTPPPETAERPAEAPPVYVQFRLSAEGAQSVALAGTFTGWKPAVLLRQTAPGEWTALVPLAPGVHDYAFVVDGERWVADPHAAHVDDSFGGTNSRISLPPLGTST